jgi:hypothetical protein
MMALSAAVQIEVLSSRVTRASRQDPTTRSESKLREGSQSESGKDTCIHKRQILDLDRRVGESAKFIRKFDYLFINFGVGGALGSRIRRKQPLCLGLRAAAASIVNSKPVLGDLCPDVRNDLFPHAELVRERFQIAPQLDEAVRIAGPLQGKATAG